MTPPRSSAGIGVRNWHCRISLAKHRSAAPRHQIVCKVDHQYPHDHNPKPKNHQPRNPWETNSCFQKVLGIGHLWSWWSPFEALMSMAVLPPWDVTSATNASLGASSWEMDFVEEDVCWSTWTHPLNKTSQKEPTNFGNFATGIVGLG